MGWGLRVTAFLLSGLLALGCVPSGGGGDGGGGSGGGEAPEPPEADPPPAELIEGLVSIAVSMRPSYDLIPGLPRDFFAEGTYDDGSTQDLSADVVWTSSDPEVLSFDDPEVPNRATVDRERTDPLLVTATLGDISGELQIGEGGAQPGGPCVYPEHTTDFVAGSTMPPLVWQSAALPGGERGVFDLEQIYCGEVEEDVPDVYVFLLVAMWCQPCHAEMQEAVAQAQAMIDAGGQFVIVLLQNLDTTAATTDQAIEGLGDMIGDAPVILGGDADIDTVIGSSDALDAFPSVLIVRTQDMQIIGDRNNGGNWRAYTPAPPPPPMVDDNCGPDDEGVEPNNGPAEATPIGAGTLDDGICDAHADYFTIDIDGPWRATLEFEHAVGNLDLYAWDGEKDEPLRVNNQVVGSFGVLDTEVVEHSGPTMVRVGGFRFESAPYTLTVEAL